MQDKYLLLSTQSDLHLKTMRDLIPAKLPRLFTLPLRFANCAKQQKNPRELDVQLLREPFENTESFGTSYHTATKMRKDKIIEAYSLGLWFLPKKKK